MKKNLLFLALGLAVGVQAQEATPQAAPAQSANNSQAAVAPAAPAPQAAAPAEAAPAPAAEPAAEATAPAAVAEPAAPAEDATAPAAEQVAEPAAQTADSSAVQTAPVAEPAADTAPAQAAADSAATPVEQPTETASAEPAAPVADSTAQAAPVDSAAVAPAAPAQQAAAPAKAPSMLDGIIHGNAYNTVGNEAAGATVDGDMASPHKMRGHKLVYFEPINQKGVVSFGENRTYYFAFDNTDKLGHATAGIAFDKFGVAIDGANGRTWSYDNFADGSENIEKNVVAGSMIGASASIDAGPVDVTLKGHYSVPEDYTFTSVPGNEVDPKIWDATGALAVSYAGEVVSWTFGVDFLRHDSKTTTMAQELKVIDGKNYIATTRTTVSDTSSRFEVVPSFNVGGAVLEAENARVYLGLNTYFPIAVYDKIENVVDKHQEAAAYLAPNIFGEVMLSKYFMAFGGARYDWEAASVRQYELAGNTEKDVKSVTGTTTVDLGARFQYDRAALELSFTQQFLQNPFGSFSSTDEISVNLGAFINF